MIFWCVGIAMLLVLLIQGVFGRRWLSFPFFYAQLAVALAFAVVSLYIFRFHPQIYTPVYWTGQFVTMVLACGNIFEVLRHTFPRNVGAERFVRGLKCGLLACLAYFGAAVTYGHWAWHVRYVVIERNFRTLQALLLLVLLLGVYYFGLPLRRQVRGIFYGYGLYIGTSLATLALEASLGIRFDYFWRFLQPFSYVVSLGIYLAAFWSPSLSISVNHAVDHHCAEHQTMPQLGVASNDGESA
jgi:hypothetical protein